MYTPDPDKKFDFQHMDVKLYLALKAIIGYAENEVDGLHTSAGRDFDEALQADAEVGSTRCQQARDAMEEFEQSFGPVPDWAVGRNFGYELVPGAQLCTKDGRKIGNGYIIQIKDVQYHCLTDAGSKFIFTEQDIETCFTIGDWIYDPIRVLKDFDREGHFDTQGE